MTQGGGAVQLRWSDGTGNWVEKKVAAGKGKYAVDVEVRAGGVPARAGVVIATGIEKALKVDQQGRFGGESAVVRVDGKVDRVLAAKLDGVRSVRGAIDFAGVEDQYFLLALLPNDPVAEVRISRSGTGATALPEVAVVGTGGAVAGTLYAGAKERTTLVGYGRGLAETLSFGIFGFLSVGFLAALRWIYGWVGNWGVAIIVLTAGIRILLFPLNHKSAVAMKRMQALQPKMKAIQDRYKDRAKKDPNVRTRMNQEVMQMYKEEGVNPMGGCLPMLVQLPILWALYSLFAYAIELRQAPFVFWIHDLAAKDPTYITPILMTASMVLQQRMAPQVGDPAQRRMFMFMPFIFGFMFMSFPAGLVLYWLVNNLFTIGQQLLTERMMTASAATAQRSEGAAGAGPGKLGRAARGGGWCRRRSRSALARLPRAPRAVGRRRWTCSAAPIPKRLLAGLVRDALAALPYLGETDTLIDIGSGNGFPGGAAAAGAARRARRAAGAARAAVGVPEGSGARARAGGGGRAASAWPTTRAAATTWRRSAASRPRRGCRRRPAWSRRAAAWLWWTSAANAAALAGRCPEGRVLPFAAVGSGAWRASRSGADVPRETFWRTL